MLCNKCGNQIPDGSAFCGICGNRLDAPDVAVDLGGVRRQDFSESDQPIDLSPVDEPGQQTAQPEKKQGISKKRKIIDICILIGVIIVVFIYAGISMGFPHFGSDENKSPVTTQALETKLKLANSTAKLVYSTVEGECIDQVAIGFAQEVKNCSSGRIVSVESLKDSSNSIDRKIYDALKNDGTTKDYIYFEIDNEKYYPTFVQWCESKEETIVGQYPDPSSDPKEEHTIGEKFTPGE